MPVTTAAEPSRSRRQGLRPATRRWAVAAIASIALIGVLAPSTAGAAVRIYRSSEDATFLGKVTRAKCKVKREGRLFRAVGKTTNGAYKLDVFILGFQGFGPDYNVPFGVLTPSVDVEGVTNGEDFSNAYPFPGGMPPPSAGAIAFGRRGARLGVGVYALPNTDYSQGVVLAGALACQYPRR
ncbi:MAG: hypothetical protein ACXWZ3_08045 [Solirubrobacterales bacterium]